MREANLTLTGWGRHLRAAVTAQRPERHAEALRGFAASAGPHGICLFGNGRSYGDCALNSGGAALLTARLDRVLGFDEATGIVTAEPGVTFDRLLTAFLPRGFLPAVTPGTAFATLGGALAHDVHGKNHEHAGSFGQHVVEFDLQLPNGAVRTVTPADADLFRATIGGLGLTGFVTRIAFRLQRVPGAGVRVTERRVRNLDEFLAAMQDSAAAPYSVGWIDGTARGAALGRGILETAEPIFGPVAPPSGRTRRVPFDLPGFALNPLSVSAFNAAYWRRVPAAGRVSDRHYRGFLYPLDAILGWNRIYGARGFHQFQCVVPYEEGPAVLRRLLGIVTDSRQASFLAVLKRMGPGRAGLLSFPRPGYTLALDFPHRAGIEKLFVSLTAATLDAGGRLYLAKDSLLDPVSFRRMYPEFPEFRRILAEIDPACRMQSDMARRLDLHGAA